MYLKIVYTIFYVWDIFYIEGLIFVNISRLREIREDRDLFQKDIAKIIGATQQQYSEYELGIRIIPLDKISKLADFYNTSVDYLSGRTDAIEPYPKSLLSIEKKYFYLLPILSKSFIWI